MSPVPVEFLLTDYGFICTRTPTPWIPARLLAILSWGKVSPSFLLPPSLALRISFLRVKGLLNACSEGSRETVSGLRVGWEGHRSNLIGDPSALAYGRRGWHTLTQHRCVLFLLCVPRHSTAWSCALVYTPTL